MQPELIMVLVQAFLLVLPILVLVGALIIGTWIEKEHFKQLDADEAALSYIMYTDLKRYPDNWVISNSSLVCGQCVIANDRFKSWLARWISFFGGRIAGYERLMDRARREAIVRMLSEAAQLQAGAVWNVRVETSSIRGKDHNSIGGVEVLAYGTAISFSNQ